MEFALSIKQNSQPRKRHINLANFYAKSTDSVCYCPDVYGLFQEIGIAYSASDWRIFSNNSKQSLKSLSTQRKCIFINSCSTCCVGMKEDRESVKTFLDLTQYRNPDWYECGDLKMIALLLGLQGGYNKYSYFLLLVKRQSE